MYSTDRTLCILRYGMSPIQKLPTSAQRLPLHSAHLLYCVAGIRPFGFVGVSCQDALDYRLSTWSGFLVTSFHSSKVILILSSFLFLFAGWRHSYLHVQLSEHSVTKQSCTMAPAVVETPSHDTIPQKPQNGTSSGYLLRKPLVSTGALDKYDSYDITPVVGREFPHLDLTELINAPNADELLAELALTSTQHSLERTVRSDKLTHELVQSPSAASSSSANKIISPTTCKRN